MRLMERLVRAGSVAAVGLATFTAHTLSGQEVTSPDGEPRAGWEDGAFFLESAGGDARLTLGGRLQPRYEFRNRPGGQDTSSFFMRRIRADLRGQVLDERVSFRIMPELARTAELRDGWVEIALHPALQIRGGQFVVPFHWHRFVSGNRQFFAERSEPAETFGVPTGYDIGVGVHGRNDTNTLAYGAGLFDGAGRNVGESNSTGHMVSGRVTWAPEGVLPDEEPDFAYSEEEALAVGLGVQGATRNEVRDWDLARSDAGNSRADWAATTADVNFRHRGLSAVAEGYARRVAPDDPQVSPYTGWAYTLGAGYFVVPGEYEIAGRLSRQALDRRDPDTRTRQWAVALNRYHSGHLWKTHFQVFRNRSGAGTELVALVQLHLQF